MVTKLKPYNPSASELVPSWHVIDAKDKVLGRLGTEIAMKLMGKDRPGYVPHLLSGDFVVVINADKIKLTGQKAQTKVYRRHSQKPGNLKEIPYETVLEKFPERIIERTVRGMLPKNKLGVQMLSRLKVYAGEEHPHSAQLVGSERRLAAIAAGELELPVKKSTRRRKPKEAKPEAAAPAKTAPATEAPAEEAPEAAEEEAPKTAAKKAPAKKAATTRTRKTAASKSSDSKSTKSSTATKKAPAKKAAAKTGTAKSTASKSSTTRKASTSKASSSKSASGTSTRRSTSRSSSSKKSGE